MGEGGRACLDCSSVHACLVNEKFSGILGRLWVLFEGVFEEFALGARGTLSVFDDIGRVGEESGTRHVVDGGGCRIKEGLGCIVHVLCVVRVGWE